MKVWVTRDNDCNGIVELHAGPQPAMGDGGYYYPIGSVGHLLRDTRAEFKAHFGFTPRKGSCKQYKLTLEAI